jgi:hypothetical protein
MTASSQQTGSTNKPRGRVRRRVMFGGVLAAVVALAMMLQGLFDGFGFGNGGGGGIGDGQNSDANNKKSSKTTSEEEKKIIPGQIVEVRLDKKQFFLRSAEGKTSKQPVQISEILEYASKTKKSTDVVRVRVRILVRGGGILSRRDELVNALLKNGIKRLEIDVIDDDT